jgi:hypothetical protein
MYFNKFVIFVHRYVSKQLPRKQQYKYAKTYVQGGRAAVQRKYLSTAAGERVLALDGCFVRYISPFSFDTAQDGGDFSYDTSHVTAMSKKKAKQIVESTDLFVTNFGTGAGAPALGVTKSVAAMPSSKPCGWSAANDTAPGVTQHASGVRPAIQTETWRPSFFT